MQDYRSECFAKAEQKEAELDKELKSENCRDDNMKMILLNEQLAFDHKCWSDIITS